MESGVSCNVLCSMSIFVVGLRHSTCSVGRYSRFPPSRVLCVTPVNVCQCERILKHQGSVLFRMRASQREFGRRRLSRLSSLERPSMVFKSLRSAQRSSTTVFTTVTAIQQFTRRLSDTVCTENLGSADTIGYTVADSVVYCPACLLILF